MQGRSSALVGSSHGWLVWFNASNRHLFLSEPLFSHCIELPSLPERPFKVILSHCPKRYSCHALMIHGSRDKVSSCRLGHDTRWVLRAQHSDKIYTDFVSHPAEDEFVGFALNSGSRGGDLEFWSVYSPTLRNNVGYGREEDGTSNEFKETYVVPSMDRLFLVRMPIDTNGICVFKTYDDGKEGLKLCTSLDDLAMFVGINHSFAFKPDEGIVLQRNSIYLRGARYTYLDGHLDTDTFDYPSQHGGDIPWPLPWFIQSKKLYG